MVGGILRTHIETSNLNTHTISEPWWPWPPPGAKLSVVAVAQFWHFIPLNPAVLGGWRRWPAVRGYGSSGVRRYRLRRPPTTNHCVVVGCRRHHGGSSGGGQFGPSGRDSTRGRRDANRHRGRHFRAKRASPHLSFIPGGPPGKNKESLPSSFFYFEDPLDKKRLEPADAILSFFARCLPTLLSS